LECAGALPLAEVAMVALSGFVVVVHDAYAVDDIREARESSLALARRSRLRVAGSAHEFKYRLCDARPHTPAIARHDTVTVLPAPSCRACSCSNTSPRPS
jgi:hypothetical protein